MKSKQRQYEAMCYLANIIVYVHVKFVEDYPAFHHGDNEDRDRRSLKADDLSLSNSGCLYYQIQSKTMQGQ